MKLIYFIISTQYCWNNSYQCSISDDFIFISLSHSFGTSDDTSVWRGPLCWHQLIWWKENTLIAVGWDTQMHADVVCEFLIQMGKANNVIILGCVTYLKSHLFNVTYLERFSNDCQKNHYLIYYSDQSQQGQTVQ